MDNEDYKPVVPKWVARLLELEKKTLQSQYSGVIASGKTRKDWDKWKHSYSRKFKYAMSNGWIVEDGESE